jgi:membrane-associated PAP2 superfamily phosphatase
MDFKKLKSLLDDRAQKEVGYDFLKDAREIMRGNFPKMRKMKRRLALEVACMACFAMALGWFQYLLPGHPVWVTILLVSVIGLFLALEIAAFRAYWYTPAGIGYVESMRKFSRRLNTAVNPMIIINVSLAIFNIALVFIGANVVSMLNWQRVILLLLLQAGVSAFSARWVSHAKRARRQVTELMNENKFVL